MIFIQRSVTPRSCFLRNLNHIAFTSEITEMNPGVLVKSPRSPEGKFHQLVRRFEMAKSAVFFVNKALLVLCSNYLNAIHCDFSKHQNSLRVVTATFTNNESPVIISFI